MGQREGSPWLVGGRRCGSPYRRHHTLTSWCLRPVVCRVFNNKSILNVYFYCFLRLQSSDTIFKLKQNINLMQKRNGSFSAVRSGQCGLDRRSACGLTCRSDTLYTPGTASLSAGWAWLRSQDRRRDSAAHNPYRTTGPQGPLQSRRRHTKPPGPL